MYNLKNEDDKKIYFFVNKFVIKIFNEKLKVKSFLFFSQHGKFQFFKI